MGYADGKLSEHVVRAEDGLAVVVTSLDHTRVHRGEVFGMAAVLSALNDGQSYVLHIKTGANEVHLVTDVSGSGAGYARLYEGPTVSEAGDGTEITPVNRMRISARQATILAKLYHTPTTTADGTLLSAKYFGSANKGAGQAERSEEWVLKPNTSYLFKLESDAASNIMSYELVMYERA